MELWTGVWNGQETKMESWLPHNYSEHVYEHFSIESGSALWLLTILTLIDSSTWYWPTFMHLEVLGSRVTCILNKLQQTHSVAYPYQRSLY